MRCFETSFKESVIKRALLASLESGLYSEGSEDYLNIFPLEREMGKAAEVDKWGRCCYILFLSLVLLSLSYILSDCLRTTELQFGIARELDLRSNFSSSHLKCLNGLTRERQIISRKKIQLGIHPSICPSIHPLLIEYLNTLSGHDIAVSKTNMLPGLVKLT